MRLAHGTRLPGVSRLRKENVRTVRKRLLDLRAKYRKLIDNGLLGGRVCGTPHRRQYQSEEKQQGTIKRSAYVAPLP